MGAQQKGVYRFGPFRVDSAERVLRRDGRVVQLTPKVFDTLLVLVENSGRLISKDELIETLWPDSYVEEWSLSQNISLLRRALGDSSGKRQYIETVAKRGYRFSSVVTEEDKEGEGAVTPGKRSGGAAVARSIAILPFKQLTTDDSDEHIGIGIADALITKLSNIGRVIVRPTSAVLKYSNLSQSLVTVAQDLGVETILEGSIRRHRGSIRVTVQLVSARDQATMWADKFDEASGDIFAIEDRISEQVTRALMLRLTGEEQRRLIKRHTENPEAYRLYVKGLYYTNKATREGAQKGIEHYTAAIAADPGYAQAYAGLAEAYCWLSHTFLSPAEAMPKAKAAAVRALEIDDTLAEAHFALALVKMWHEWDWPDTEREFKKAICFNPNLAPAHVYYGYYLTAMGRFNEAVAEIKLAQEIDPLSLLASTTLGWSLYFARRYDQAIEQWERTLEMEPNFLNAYWGLGWAYNQKGDYGEAINRLQKAMTVPGGGGTEIIAALGNTYARSGKRDKARKLLADLKELSARRYVSPFYFALVYAGLDDKEQAIECLHKSYEDRFEWLIQLKKITEVQLFSPEGDYGVEPRGLHRGPEPEYYPDRDRAEKAERRRPQRYDHIERGHER